MFAEKLRLLRKERNMTQTELSKSLGVSPSSIGMYEQGRREPDSQTLLKVANFFDVTAGYLIGDEEIARTQNVEEIAELVSEMLKKKEYLFYEGRPLKEEDLDRIIRVIREGIHEAMEEIGAD